MSFDAASSEPRKRSWKRLIIVLACVVAVITIVLLAIPPKKEPVKVWFVRATNELGVKKLVLEGTNGLPREIQFAVFVFTGGVHQAKPTAGFDEFYDWTNLAVDVGTNIYFTVSAPAKDVPYYVR